MLSAENIKRKAALAAFLFYWDVAVCQLFSAALAAARRAIGTLNGLHET